MHSKSLRSLDGALSPIASDLPEDLFDVFSDNNQPDQEEDNERKVSVFKIKLLALMVCRGTY